MIMETMLVRFFRYLVDWRKTRAIIRELNSLTDKQLKDIGIMRDEINHLVYTMQQEKQRGSRKGGK